MTASRLPDLAELLDPARLQERLTPITDERGTLTGVAPFYLRWKPGTSALLGVRLAWQTEEGVVETLASLYLGDGLQEAADKAETLRLLEPRLGPPLMRLDDALFLAFPNDRLLKGLSAVADERRIGNRLGAPDTQFSERGFRVKARGSVVRVVRWKPGRRAVLELDLRLVNDTTGEKESWRAYARVLPAGELDARLARWFAASQVRALKAPAVVFVDTERSWFATAAAAGRSLAATPNETLLASLRAAFSELHAAPNPTLSTRTERDDLVAAERALDALALVAPDLEPRAQALRQRLALLLETLAPAASVFTHGDLGADQLLVEGNRLAVIDWDEAANGDPHFDWGSLQADLRGRGMETSWVEPLARAVLAERFDATRMAWQHAAHEARRVVEGLQRARTDWRARALDTLAAAETRLSEAFPFMPVARPSRASQVGEWLSALLDPARRMSVPGVDASASRLAAVWPEGDDGAIVRLEHPDAPGKVVRWLRLGASVEVFTFPEDPALPALSGLLSMGRFAAAGHRLGKRAALRELDGSRFLFLRAEGGVAKAFARVTEAYRRLESVGVPASRPLMLAEGLPGWWAEGVPGKTIDPANEPDTVWETLGSTLQRAHASAAPDAVAADGLVAAISAGRKQIALMRLADPALADELDRDLDRVSTRVTAPGRAAYIHGDLHPLQILTGSMLIVLDWERGRLGEAEEDLGNFLAHLAWEAFDAAPAAWAAFLRGYEGAGGSFDVARVAAHAEASLARVRAVHGWRDGSQQRARATTRWQGWREGLQR